MFEMIDEDTQNIMYDKAHNFWKFLMKLDREDLETLASLIVAIPLSDPKATASYYNGFVESVLYLKYGVCPTCEEVHEINDHSAFTVAMDKKLSKLVSEKSSANAPSVPTQDTGVEHRPGNYL